MNQHEADLLVMGSSLGLLAGTWIGYKLRGIRETIAERRFRQGELRELNLRAERAMKKLAEPMPKIATPWRDERVTPREVPITARPKVIPLDVAKVEQRIDKVTTTIQLSNGAGKTATAEKAMQEMTRDLVVEALRGAGYKKSEAEAATDACHPGDRVSLEIWTAAALRRAVLSK